MKKIFLLFSLCILSGIPLSVKAASGDFAAQRINQRHAQIIELKAGETINFWVTFKNKGTAYWPMDGQDKLILRTSSGLASKFKTNKWPFENTPLIKLSKYVFSGEEVTLNFELKALDQMGLVWEKFNLFAGSNFIKGGEIEIPIKTITGKAPSLPSIAEKQYWQTIASEIKIIENKKMTEPEIKVGLLYIEEEEKTKYLPLSISTRNNKTYDINDQNNNLLIKNTQGEKIYIDFDYKNNRYFISDALNRRLLMTDSPLKFSSSDLETIFKIDSWQNAGSFWSEETIDNEFLGKIKIQYNPSTQRLWMINELPLEQYLEGVAEAGDSAHSEFQKVQAITARTYALFRINNPKYTATPTGDGIFDLRSTQADQVYRGIKQAERAPNFISAVNQTKGIAATYEDKPILAYYFAQSDGKTRSSQVVGMTKGPVSYLVERIDPPGEGKTLLGHGVGLPQRSGIAAANEGANFSQILKYYYSGINLTRLY